MNNTLPASTKTKIPIKLITIDRAEGPTELCVSTKHETWKSAEERIQNICRSAPKAGGYDKCDFKLVFLDDETYEGRYDAAHQESTAYEGSLEKHVRSHLTFMAGLHCPAHMTEADYERLVREYDERGAKSEALAFLTKYALNDDEADPFPNSAPKAPPMATAAIPAAQPTAREAHDLNVAHAKANNLKWIPVLGNTYPVKGVLYAFGGRYDPLTKSWSVPSHKHAEAQAAADKFAKPAPKAKPAPEAVRPVITDEMIAAANRAAMTPRQGPAEPAPRVAPQAAPVARRTQRRTSTPTVPPTAMKRRLEALLAGMLAIQADNQDGDIKMRLAQSIDLIEQAIQRLK